MFQIIHIMYLIFIKFTEITENIAIDIFKLHLAIFSINAYINYDKITLT